MRADHTAAETIPSQPLASTPLDGAGEDMPQRPARALTRAAFCFAWLFGLEPFLAVSTDDARGSRLDRHQAFGGVSRSSAHHLPEDGGAPRHP
ncbi:MULTISPECIES: hypothetical protein [unclassified Paraburkholderia]|uniref:hypothetical protein n=1 Tax=unclassified Paraburkholderia TaxID=2615204 RepID=UPI001965687A|nr:MULTISPECIES: hypothetical protein [unclassified Paraburkholderia]